MGVSKGKAFRQFYHAAGKVNRMRIVQYKMILKRDLIPIQGDPENVRRRGGLRRDASTHAERRSAHPGTDSRVPQRQSADRIQRSKPSRVIRVRGEGADRA